jgi:hypothetical protein
MATTQKLLVRSRALYAALALLILPLGLAVRINAERLPAFFGSYAPDMLWALLVFVVAAVLFPRLATWRLALLVLGFAILVECSQLYRAPWINNLRAIRVGGLILGHGFLWSDLVCYTVGVAIGVVLDSSVRLMMIRLREQPLAQ